MEPSQKRDPLRDAIERTFAATAGTRERAQELLDDVSRRGREAVSRPLQEAQEASAGVASRVAEALDGVRFVTRDELRALERRLDRVNARLRKLESQAPPEG